MANAAITAPMRMVRPDEHDQAYESMVIASTVIVNQGDPVSWNSSGNVVVATFHAGAIIKPYGAAFFDFDNIGITNMTGDGLAYGTSVTVITIARRCKLLGATSTLVPSLASGLPVYLADYATSTVSGYTCAPPTTTTQAIIEVGIVSPNGTELWLDFTCVTSLQFQTSGNSTLTSA